MSWQSFRSALVSSDSSSYSITAAPAHRIASPRYILVFMAGLGATCSTVLFSATAYAQNEPAMEEVVVTGSSIKRTANDGSLPVQVFEQKEIVMSGATSVTDFLQQLPAMQGFTSVTESVGGTGGGITTASLHDVGEQYTLVLLNGRRVAPSDSGTTIDLNSIPLAAIQRVEVLTDGASAIYGADAIAGVVNFILKQGESPLELSARMSRPQHPGGSQVNVAMSKGFGDLKADGYSAFFAVSYDKLNAIKGKQRDFAKTGILSGKQGNLNYDFFNGSSRSVPPNVDVRGPTADAAVWGTDSDGNALKGFSFSPYYYATGTCPSSRVAHVLVGDQCFIDYTSTIEIQPEVERKAIYGTGNLALGSSGWNVFADLAFTDVRTKSSIAPYPAEFSLSPDSSLYATYIEPYVTAAQDAAIRSPNGGVNVKYRLYDQGNRLDEYLTDALHLVTGLQGEAAGWDMTGAITISNQKQEENYQGGWPLASSFNALMDSGTFDPFSEAPLSAAEKSALKSTEYNGNYKTTKIRMLGFEANAQRKLFELPGGSFVASFGAEYRKNGYKETPSSVAANAEILFDDPQPAFDLSRNNYGVFAEVLAPVLSSVELTGAVRYDAVSGTDDKATNTRFGSTETATTFKVGAKWQPLRAFAVRTSYGTGFRVATMKEIAQPKVDFGVTGGSFDCPFSPSYDPLGYIAAGYECPDGLQYEVFKSGNGSLKPEKSKQWNLGFILKPLDRLSIELNYWSVTVKDAVDSVSESLILDNPAKYLSLYTIKPKDNGLTYVAILDTPINIGRKENAGIDWDFSYSHPVGAVTVSGRISGTHLTTSRYTVPGTDDQWTSSLNKYGVDDKVAFRDVIHASVGLAYSGWEHTLSGNYRNGYTDVPYTVDDCVFTDDAGDCVAGALHVPSYVTADWMTSWTFEKVTLGFSVRNLFDKTPPLSLRSANSHQLGYDPRYTDSYLRTFVVNATIKY